MARTNAFICDRCGKTAKQDNRYQIRTRGRLSWASDWNRVIDLCSSCYKEFKVFMDQHEQSVPMVWTFRLAEESKEGPDAKED